jgi:hypothetical protein
LPPAPLMVKSISMLTVVVALGIAGPVGTAPDRGDKTPRHDVKDARRLAIEAVVESSLAGLQMHESWAELNRGKAALAHDDDALPFPSLAQRCCSSRGR